MSESWWLGAASAFWLGILTSVSPCPLATNVAAVTYIGRQLGSPRRIILSGLMYAVGRIMTYGVLGALIVASVISAVGVSDILQSYMSKLLGPLLVLTGMLLLELISIPLPGLPSAERWQGRAAGGLWTPALLGLLFALAFCPVSAALFFGSLIPLSVAQRSPIAFPILYGVGTGLPVVIFGLGLGLGAHWVAAALNRLAQIERWARRATGAVFIAVGIYLSLKYIFALW
jgi:cytochrome c biogenesis protein CcdA